MKQSFNEGDMVYIKSPDFIKNHDHSKVWYNTLPDFRNWIDTTLEPIEIREVKNEALLFFNGYYLFPDMVERVKQRDFNQQLNEIVEGENI